MLASRVGSVFPKRWYLRYLNLTDIFNLILSVQRLYSPLLSRYFYIFHLYSVIASIYLCLYIYHLKTRIFTLSAVIFQVSKYLTISSFVGDRHGCLIFPRCSIIFFTVIRNKFHHLNGFYLMIYLASLNGFESFLLPLPGVVSQMFGKLRRECISILFSMNSPRILQFTDFSV